MQSSASKTSQPSHGGALPFSLEAAHIQASVALLWKQLYQRSVISDSDQTHQDCRTKERKQTVREGVSGGDPQTQTGSHLLQSGYEQHGQSHQMQHGYGDQQEDHGCREIRGNSWNSVNRETDDPFVWTNRVPRQNPVFLFARLCLSTFASESQEKLWQHRSCTNHLVVSSNSSEWGSGLHLWPEGNTSPAIDIKKDRLFLCVN